MDSELANVAAVKGINQALTTTSSPTFAGITGPLTGNASTASTLATARTINLGGEVTGSASFDGGSDITITGTIAANSVGINELALNDGSNGQFLQTNGSGTITFASAIGSSVINNSAANRITTVNANTSDFDAESNLTFDGSTLALTGNMTASGTIDGVDISARDAVLTSTTTTANAALPKAGGAMTGAITSATAFTIDSADDINLDAAGNAVRFKSNGNEIGQVSMASSDLAISASTQDKDIIFKGNDGGSTVTALTLDISEAGKATFNAGATFGNDLLLGDNVKTSFGDDQDFEIYHSGSASIIREASAGNLILAGNDVQITNGAMNETHIDCNNNGSVDLFHDNTKKFETTSSGIDVTGNIVVSGTVDGVDVATRDGVLTSTTTTANAALPTTGGTMTGDLAYADTVQAKFGAGEDLKIYHDNSNNVSFITESGSAALHIRGDNIVLKSQVDNDDYMKCIENGAVELYHSNSKKLETTSSGVTVTGTLTATTLAGSLPYGSLTGTPTIPSNTNQLTNGSGYVTSSGVTSVATGNGLSGGTITSTGTLTMSGSYSGSFSASGNITAYSSDERLKDFKGKIENALDKVDKLNGYYYEWNDTAKGIDAEAFKDGVEIGVNAQEVEAVMPEVVAEAPIVKIHELDTDYKTVHYDKLVPLLIESIKELKAEIEILKKDK